MLAVLIVGLGGFLGSIIRHLLSSAMPLVISGGLKFPLATLMVNIIGSFLIGFLIPIFDLNSALHEKQRLFLITGILGGFTTFSAFSLETVLLIKEGNILYAAISVLAHLFLGFAAVAAGFSVAKSILH